ncbi:MAG TPA: hypothetical protein PLY93_02760, partial [Turneriella sp.]|nr:hypothetical protein [Turneriella sp.]
MNWQTLKNKFLRSRSKDAVGVITPMKKTLIDRFLAWFSISRNRFRFIVLLFVLDFVAFMSLTRSSYLQLLNPIAFLSVSKDIGMETMELYFPRSLSLTGIEKIYSNTDDAPTIKIQNDPQGNPADDVIDQTKVLDDAQVKAEVIAIQKKVAHPIHEIDALNLTANEARARRVMYELIAGPSGDLDTLKARNLL